MNHPDKSQPPSESTRVSGPLLIFYTCCAAVSLGAALTAMAFFLFADPASQTQFNFMLGVGGLLLLLGVPGAFISLAAARR